MRSLASRLEDPFSSMLPHGAVYHSLNHTDMEGRPLSSGIDLPAQRQSSLRRKCPISGARFGAFIQQKQTLHGMGAGRFFSLGFSFLLCNRKALKQLVWKALPRPKWCGNIRVENSPMGTRRDLPPPSRCSSGLSSPRVKFKSAFNWICQFFSQKIIIIISITTTSCSKPTCP